MLRLREEKNEKEGVSGRRRKGTREKRNNRKKKKQRLKKYTEGGKEKTR